MKIIYDDYPLAGLLFVLKLFLLTIYLLVIKLCNIHLIEPIRWVSFFFFFFFLNWGHPHFHYLKQKYQSTSIFVTWQTNNTVTRLVDQHLVGNLYLPRGLYFFNHNTKLFYQSLSAPPGITVHLLGFSFQFRLQCF